MTKSLKTILTILILLILAVFIFYSSSQPESPPPPNINEGLTETEKENAAQIMNQQLKNIPPLTDKQKEDIAKQMIESLSK